MSQSPKIPRKQAEAIARDIHLQLGPYCEKFTFAGSLRRLCPEVGDIEAVVLPTMMEVEDSLFTTTRVRSRELVMAVMNLGHHLKGDPLCGRHVKLNIGGKRDLVTDAVQGGVQFDLFIPQPSDYGRILAIRTGPPNYSARVLAVRWTEMGWCGVAGLGLRRKSQCTDHGKDGKHDWRLNSGLSSVMMPPEFPTEESFFAFLGLKWIAPRERNI